MPADTERLIEEADRLQHELSTSRFADRRYYGKVFGDLMTALRAERERAEKAEEQARQQSVWAENIAAVAEQTNAVARDCIRERDTARAELARLTTPRPIAEAPTDKPVIGIWLDHQGKMCVEVLRFDGRWLGAPGTPIYREAEFLPLPVLP